MASPRRRAVTSPALAAFGRQFRRYRERAGLSQARVAQRTGKTASFVSQVESGKKRCKRDFVEIMDPELRAGGVLLSLHDDLTNDEAVAFPSWFDWPTIEGEAAMLTSWQPTTVHGLVQIRSYAGAILRGNEEAIEARMARQAVLTRDVPPPPIFSLYLDEGVLYREVGNPGIMREQLNHLIACVSDRLMVHVVPSRGEHLGNVGSVTLAKMDDLSEVAYAETIPHGVTIEEPHHLKLIHQALAEIRGLAYSVAESTARIREVVEKKWT
ncbi:helix-turn-helix domain-containing protein [Actinomadura formosensis]|uniref:helix-turn-helix domain-containing protein n=1 Tax=Actinomadura formosensis TaxID=60706 RepID=UPI000A0311B3|nr:helix-turn-helix transcriptional regulator [Actinomadura formosensis]